MPTQDGQPATATITQQHSSSRITAASVVPGLMRTPGSPEGSWRQSGMGVRIWYMALATAHGDYLRQTGHRRLGYLLLCNPQAGDPRQGGHRGFCAGSFPPRSGVPGESRNSSTGNSHGCKKDLGLFRH